MLRIHVHLIASALCALRSTASGECRRPGEAACGREREEVTATADDIAEVGASLGLLEGHLEQREAEKGGSAFSLSPAVKGAPELVASVKPVAWFHVAKCGSSLLNALIRLPGICRGLPEDVIIHTWNHGEDLLVSFYRQYPPLEYCPDGFSSYGQHAGMGSRDNYEKHWKGHAVTMLRDPQQRIMSAWADNRHSWPVSETNPLPDDPVVYAKQVSGCVAKMLVRPGYALHWGGPCGEGPPPSREEMEEAKRRLREGFAFIGLVEEWPLSMCLFHATFGGPCHAAEFMNTRVWHLELAAPPKLRNDSLLEGYVDPYDKEIWDLAQEIFWDRVRQRDLSLEKCAPCFAQAESTRLRTLQSNRMLSTYGFINTVINTGLHMLNRIIRGK